jgi:hypothetical protein
VKDEAIVSDKKGPVFLVWRDDLICPEIPEPAVIGVKKP